MTTSNTPRTDTAERYVHGHIDRKWVTAEFDRLLERELNAAKERIEKLKTRLRHDEFCMSPLKPCTCGLSKLLEEIKA